ncbi:NAD(P)/FAD-dependent oxidoreductase [Nibrella saemangeumensis]|uniref:NAD(P)/FAD-dependent oxidoreductase n=1 Tax=Nibrella saemangeumensis TaxID=1084526 RepID=A0ABP8MZG9_9BACT
MKAFDVIIVGSGINSLTAGAILSKQGKKVAIFERNHWLGGNILTDETVFPGFRTDVLSAYHTLFVTGPAYQECKDDLTAHGLRYRNTPVPTASIVPGRAAGDARSILFYTDRQRTIEEINRHTPGDGDLFGTLLDEFQELYADLVINTLTSDVRGWDAVKLGTKGMFSLGPSNSLELLGMAMRSARIWLDMNFKGEMTKALLAPWVLHLGQSPDDATSSLMIQVVFSLLEKVGLPMPEGGGSRMAEAWIKIIRDHGGVLFTRAQVDSITVENDKVTGVLVNGERVGADYVLANVTPTQLYGQLIHKDLVPAAISRETREYRYGRGDFVIHLTLDAPPHWPDDRLLEAGVIHITDGLDGLSQSCVDASRQVLPHWPTLTLGQHMAVDPSRGPQGTWILSVQAQTVPNVPVGDAAGQITITNGWTDDVNEAYADRIIDQIEAVAPGFRRQITDRLIMSPTRLNELNPNMVGGDIYSGACTIDQFLIWRPFKRMMPHETPFANLFHIGASTHPGPGLAGTSGYLVAKGIH